MARFLDRVLLENYKSIAHCDVELKDLTFLVGPNGAGKSNFLESLSLLTTCKFLRNTYKNYPFKTIFQDKIRRNANNLKISVDTQGRRHWIRYASSEVKTAIRNLPDNIFMIYNLSTIKYTHPYESKLNSESKTLHKDGENISSIILNLANRSPDEYEQINRYINRINTEITKVWVLFAGGYDILQFDCVGSNTPFNASQMSDGTLHALGVLTAIFHAKSAGIPLIGIEEPEAGLHPAAARVMREALIEASKDVQIIVTSHSPDLLDSPDIDPDSILAVVRENGETKIGPIDAASREALKEHLFTAGELLRMNQLEPAA